MRRVEVTSIGAIYYLAPFLFLAIDSKIVHVSLSGGEVAGIFLLVLGGLGFAIDGKTHRLKRELSPMVWGLFLFSILYTGVEGYLFKYLNVHETMNAVSFVASYGIVGPSGHAGLGSVATAGMGCILAYQGKWHLLHGGPARAYVPYISLSKIFDALNTILWTEALVFAAVSQVSAMEALEPLVLFVVTAGLQGLMRFHMQEKLDIKRLHWKALSVSMLVLGGMLIT